jgi:predicted Co/Zn/Cd cation transporter (cation efflux family)
VSTAPTAARREELHRRGLWLEWFTVAWNVVEAVVAIGVGLAVGSVALVGFGVFTQVSRRGVLRTSP